MNEDLNVFTENRRDVSPLSIPSETGGAPRTVMMVAVGAMMVGSIAWTVKQGDNVAKGDEMGYFAYGGSVRDFSQLI